MNNETENQWSKNELRSRISDSDKRIRHEAGSPNPSEIASYAEHSSSLYGASIVLGMTPELRRLALERFDVVFSVDSSTDAIETYSAWVDDKDNKEIIIQDDWMNLADTIEKPVQAIFGDGVIGNLGSKHQARLFLSVIRDALAEGGSFITRNAIIPEHWNVEEFNATRLRDAHRNRFIDEIEFGFGTRIIGHLECCYDSESSLLDNKKLFMEIALAEKNGFYTQSEFAAIHHFFFQGRNLILRSEEWLKMCDDAGFTITCTVLQGKHWYDYYPIYSLERR